MDMIFHITTEDKIRSARSLGEYRPQAFERERFIHCSTRDQVLSVAQRYYKGKADLVLLEIDCAKLTDEIVYENLAGGEEQFPHLYGPLPLGAVVEIHPFPCDQEGCFQLP